MGSVEDRWGTPKIQYHPMQPGSWAIFCEQKDGAYMALRRNDLIPIAPPIAASNVVEDKGFEQHAFRPARPGLLDVFFLKRLWEGGRDVPLQPRSNFSMRLQFKRKYKLPVSSKYSVKLLALVAIVGG
jgi:hypothetical protein